MWDSAFFFSWFSFCSWMLCSWALPFLLFAALQSAHLSLSLPFSLCVCESLSHPATTLIRKPWGAELGSLPCGIRRVTSAAEIMGTESLARASKVSKRRGSSWETSHGELEDANFSITVKVALIVLRFNLSSWMTSLLLFLLYWQPRLFFCLMWTIQEE